MKRLLAFALFSAAVLASLLFHSGSYLHPESASFVQNYLDDRGFFAKIFDPAKNDWGYYQARELSYVFDWFDAQLNASLLALGKLWFYQWTHFACMLAIGIFVYSKARTLMPKLGATIPAAGTLLFLLSPMVFLSGNYFRSSKALVTLAVALLSWWTYEALSARTRLGTLRLLAIGSAAALAAAADRQGLFFLAALSGVCALHALFHLRQSRDLRKNDAIILAILLGVALLSELYNRHVGPWIILAINGYRPDFSYQSIDYFAIFSSRDHYWGALHLIGDHLAWSLGLPFKQLGFALALPLSAVYFVRSRWPAWALAASFFAICTLYALMNVRHEAIGWIDVRRYYYWSPVAVLILFWLLWALHRLIELCEVKGAPLAARTRMTATTILCGLCILQALSIPWHWGYLQNGSVAREIAQMPELRRCVFKADSEADSAIDSYPSLTREGRSACLFFRAKNAGSPQSQDRHQREAHHDQRS